MVKINYDDELFEEPSTRFEKTRTFVKRDRIRTFLDKYSWNVVHQYNVGKKLTEAFDLKCESMDHSSLLTMAFYSDKDDKQEDKLGSDAITLQKKDYDYLKCKKFSGHLPYKLFNTEYNSLYDCKQECQIKEKISIGGMYDFQMCYQACHDGLKKAINDQVLIDERNVMNGNLDDIYKRLGENK